MIARLLISLLLFAAFCILVEIYFGWHALLAPWLEQSWATLFAAALLTFVSYWVRAVRLFDYFRAEMRGGFAPCFKLMLQHNLINNLLPMRTGELSFPVLMARYFGVDAMRSLPALLWFRVLDLHMLLTLALLAAGAFWLPLPAAIALALGWQMLPWWLFRSSAWLQQRLRGGGRVRALLANLMHGLPRSEHELWRTWAWTAINWVVKLGVFAWVLQLFAPMPWQAAWLGTIAGDVTSVLPVHGFAGAGTYEAGVVAGLLPFGVTPASALSAAVNLHLFLLGSTLVGGLLSLLLPGRRAHG